MSNRIYRKVELYSTKPHDISEGEGGKRVREEANKGDIRNDRSELCTVGPKGSDVGPTSEVCGGPAEGGGRSRRGVLGGVPLYLPPFQGRGASTSRTPPG